MMVTQPTSKEWQGATTLGETLAKASVGAEVIAIIARGENPAIALGVVLGTIAHMCGLAAVPCPLENRHVLEQHVLAVCRMAIRGGDVPLKDNGQPFTGCTNG